MVDANTQDRFSGYVEFRDGWTPSPRINQVLFDFDGTLSLIRQGWPEVMLPMFIEMLPPSPGESATDRRRLLHEDMMRLNGKQTIYQMRQFAERVKERGGQPAEPLWYKREYLRRLDQHISERVEAIESGRAEPDDFLVYGARAMLEELDARGWELSLASGTDQSAVQREAALLRIDRYFRGGIYGALDDPEQFSKQMVIDQILRDRQIQPDQLLAFGDGYVEIQNTKERGGLAVAVASDEARNGSGRVDSWKRDRLLGVGADAVIPDYRDASRLLECLLGNAQPV